jgi:hypothetical protein
MLARAICKSTRSGHTDRGLRKNPQLMLCDGFLVKKFIGAEWISRAVLYDPHETLVVTWRDNRRVIEQGIRDPKSRICWHFRG